MTEPKYDEDFVNLGYLKKVVSDTEENIGDTYKNVSRHYASKPNPPYNKGDTWIDGDIIYTCINSRQIGLYVESDWVTESGAKEEATRKNKTYLTQPSNYSPGDMWILQSDNDHKAGKKGEILITTAGRAEYDEGDWINMLGYGSIRSINEVADNLNEAINRIGSVEEAIEDGIIVTFYQDTVPEGKHIGDLWYVSGEIENYTKGKIYRYDGIEWKMLDDPEIQKAFEKANEARLVADGKIQSFYSETEPTENMSVGDLWIDLANNNQLYRYNGTNWVAVYDTRINELVVNVDTVTERVATIETDLGEIDLKVEENTTKVTTIQGDIKDVQKDVNNITNITSSSEGKNIHIEDSANEPLVDISLHGETVQDGTPTPENPVEIQNITGDVGVKVVNKNLLENIATTQVIEGISYTVNDDKTVTVNGTADSTSNSQLHINRTLKLKEGTYTIQKEGKNGEYWFFINLYDGNIYKSTKIVSYRESTTFTISSEEANYRCDIGIEVKKGVSVPNITFYPQIEVGTEATKYEEHQEQTVYFPLAEGQKLMEGSYLADDGIHHKRNQIVFDGSDDEKWSVSYAGTENFFYVYKSLTNFLYSSKGDTYICSHFKYGSVGSKTTDEGIFIVNNGDVRIRFGEEMTLENWKAWLQANQITVEYELANPETDGIIPYTEEQQEAWNSIKALMTYRNVTNITSDAYAKLTYMRDNGLSDMYETKQNAEKQYTETTKKIAEQNITVNGILSQVSEATSNISTINNNLTELNERTASTELRVNEFEIKFNDKTTTIDEELQKNTETINEMSYKFSTDDLKIAKETDPVHSRFNNTGMRVYSYSNLKLISNHNGTGTQKLIVVGSTQLANLQIVKGTDENGQACTDFHHLVSNIQKLEDLEVD